MSGGRTFPNGEPTKLSTDCMISVVLEGSAPETLLGTGAAAIAVAKTKTAMKVLEYIVNDLTS